MTPIESTTVHATSIDRFRHEAAALRRTLAELHDIDREGWQRESKAAQAAIAALEAELAVAEAEAQAERAESTAELEAAIGAVVAAWRARADEVRLQAHLAEMNAREALGAAEEKATAAINRLRTDLEEPFDQLRQIALKTLEGLRSDFASR